MSDASDNEENPFKIDLPVDPLSLNESGNEPEPAEASKVISLEPAPEGLSNPFETPHAEPESAELLDVPELSEPPEFAAALLGPGIHTESVPELSHSPEDLLLPAEFAEPGSAATLESLEPAVSIEPDAIPPELIDPSMAPREPDTLTAAAGANTPLPSEAASPSSAAATPMGQVREFSDQVGVAEVKASVPAAFPFSLLIEGMLNPAEREKLLDLLSRESLGIREIDIEPQLESGKILIPRISEYAGVLLVQALRDYPVSLRLGPSDEIYRKNADPDEDTMKLARPETFAKAHVTSAGSAQDPATSAPGMDGESRIEALSSPTAPHPAERIPMTPENSLPQISSYSVIDTVTASATLRSRVVEVEQGEEYQRILENLQREVRYKAFRKGAAAVIRFRIELTRLTLPSHYRVLATGVAIRPDHPNPFESPDNPGSPEAGAPLS